MESRPIEIETRIMNWCKPGRTLVIVSKGHKQHTSRLGPYSPHMVKKGYAWPIYRMENPGPDGSSLVFVDREYWEADEKDNAVRIEESTRQYEYRRCFA